MTPRPRSSSGPDKPERASVDADAADWLVAHDAGLTPERQREFEQWLAADPRHVVVWSEAQRAWARLDRLPELPHLTNVPRIRGRQRSWPAWTAAAAALLAVGIFLWPQRQPASASAPPGIVRVAPKVVVFPDGSRAKLNDGSEVTEHFTATERRVRLVRGEAHFSVEKDSVRPFVAEAGGVAVRAVGTAFNVRLDSTAIEVLVTEGRVAVAAEDSAKGTEAGGAKSELPGLQAGQRIIMGLMPEAPPPQITTMSAAEIARSLAWQGLRLRFNELSLDKVAAEFNRHNRTRLVVTESAADILVAGTFRADNVEVFVRFLEEGFRVSAERRSDGTIVLRKGR